MLTIVFFILACQMCTIIGQKEAPYTNVLFRPKGIVSKRTNEEWRKIVAEIENGDMKKLKADEQKMRKKGIKGKCELMRLEYIDIPTICPSEFMHAVLLGVVNMLLDWWRGKDNFVNTAFFKKLPPNDPLKKFAIPNNKVKEVNRRLARIKFPSRVHREMPQFGQKKWKSLDFENLLFYGWLAHGVLFGQNF